MTFHLHVIIIMTKTPANVNEIPIHHHILASANLPAIKLTGSPIVVETTSFALFL